VGLQDERLFARERDSRWLWVQLDWVVWENVRVEGPASRPTACLIVSVMVMVVW
jgi:hypothetical protein